MLVQEDLELVLQLHRHSIYLEVEHVAWLHLVVNEVVDSLEEDRLVFGINACFLHFWVHNSRRLQQVGRYNRELRAVTPQACGFGYGFPVVIYEAHTLGFRLARKKWHDLLPVDLTVIFLDLIGYNIALLLSPGGI